jgi:hypothetical protein
VILLPGAHRTAVAGRTERQRLWKTLCKRVRPGGGNGIWARIEAASKIVILAWVLRTRSQAGDRGDVVADTTTLEA